MSVLSAPVCIALLFLGILEVATSQNVQKSDPFPSTESIAKAFAFPDGKIQATDATERANEKYDNKAIAAWVFNSPDKRFLPVNSVLAEAGTLLTPEVVQKLEALLGKASEDRKVPASRVSIGDATGYAGLAGFGPGGFGVTVMLRLSSLNADLQLTMNVPHDRDVPEEPELREYAAYLNGEKDFSLALLQVTTNAVERVIQQKDRFMRTQVQPRSAAPSPRLAATSQDARQSSPRPVSASTNALSPTPATAVTPPKRSASILWWAITAAVALGLSWALVRRRQR